MEVKYERTILLDLAHRLETMKRTMQDLIAPKETKLLILITSEFLKKIQMTMK